MASSRSKHRLDVYKLPVIFTLCLMVSGSVISAESPVDSAAESYRAGDLDGALRKLEPYLKTDDADRSSNERARMLAARILYTRGHQQFRQLRIADSIADFDRQIELQPEGAAQHWQRGIALYYNGEYEKGAQQFKQHETVNPQDVENAAWHFLCMARAPGGSLETARKALIRVTDDRRVPMAQIQKLFAGDVEPNDVLLAGAQGGNTGRFYADLYVGLFYEALGLAEESLAHVASAANNPATKNNYMGDVARVHVALRKGAVKSATSRNDRPERKVLFIAGIPSHGYGAHDHWAGCKLLAKSLDDAGLPITTEVNRYGWPEDAKVLDGVDCIVVYADGGRGHIFIEHLAEMDTLSKKGVGIVCLHYAVEVPAGPVGEKLLEWIGGYFETDWSVNPHWTAEFTELPDHPITRGVLPFSINDEWYYHMRFRKDMNGITPILTDLPPPESLSRPDGPHSGNPYVRAAIARGERQHLAWAVEREDGGRGFGFTGGHVHWNWADPNFRKLVLNAIAWCAKAEVPLQGVVDRDKTLADMESNHDERVPPDFDREVIRRRYRLP